MKKFFQLKKPGYLFYRFLWIGIICYLSTTIVVYFFFMDKSVEAAKICFYSIMFLSTVGMIATFPEMISIAEYKNKKA